MQQLRVVWAEALSTAKLFKERDLKSLKTDGVVFAFSMGHTSGFTHSPTQGTYAARAVDLTDALRNYCALAPGDRVKLEAQIREIATDLIERRKAVVQCDSKDP